jgi:predicted dienelactone hydrolase
MFLQSTAILTIVFTVLAPRAMSQAGTGVYKTGMAFRRFVPSEPYNWRGAQIHALTTVIWYPAEATAREQEVAIPGLDIFRLGVAASNANLIAAPSQFPLIMISHGTGGSGLSMAWFGEALAKQGYIVAAVNHPGNNGAEPYTVEGFAERWERARDMSAVITGMLSDSEFGKHIDANRIAAAGFSLGGYTVIEAACGTAQADGNAHNCDTNEIDDLPVNPTEYPALADTFRKFIGAHPEFLRYSGPSYRDSRIRAVFAMAPALGAAFPASSLKSISVPVEVVVGESDQNIAVDSSAKYFAATIPGAKLHIFPGNVGHYVFLDSCTEAGRKSARLICIDGNRVDRDLIHRETIRLASEFLHAALR